MYVHIESWQQQINTPIQLYHMSACQDKNRPTNSSTFKQLNNEETRRVYTITSSRAYIKQGGLLGFTKNRDTNGLSIFQLVLQPLGTFKVLSSAINFLGSQEPTEQNKMQCSWKNWLNEWPTIMLSIDMSCIFFQKIVCDLFKQSWCFFFQNTK